MLEFCIFVNLLKTQVLYYQVVRDFFVTFVTFVTLSLWSFLGGNY